MDAMNDQLDIIERDSVEWFQAWDALHAEGFDRNVYMLMHATPSEFAFKHRDTRRYTYIERSA